MWVRSAAYSAIAGGRTFGGGWSQRATKRFRRAGYDESCFLLRALAQSDQPVLRAILAHVEDRLERRHDRREGGGVPRRPRRARRAADGLRPHPSRRRRAAGRGGVAGKRRTRHSGRPRAARRGVAPRVDRHRLLQRAREDRRAPGAPEPDDRGLACTRRRCGGVCTHGGAAEVDPPRRRRGRRQDDADRRGAPPRGSKPLPARVPGDRGRRERRPDVHRHARSSRSGDRGQARGPPDRLGLPELRGLALVGDALAEPARPPRRAAARGGVGRRDDHGRGRPARLRAADPEPAPRRPALRRHPPRADDRRRDPCRRAGLGERQRGRHRRRRRSPRRSTWRRTTCPRLRRRGTSCACSGSSATVSIAGSRQR